MGKFDESNLRVMLSSRMGWNVTEPACPFSHWTTYKVPVGNIVMFYAVWKDRHAELEDEATMYPSDTLVTKIRMLTS